MINVTKLHQELENMDIPIYGVSSDGRIDFKKDVTKEQKNKAETILENHNPIWYVEERLKEYPPIGEQLDMIYHDLVDNTTKWKDKIKEIKDKYPKE